MARLVIHVGPHKTGSTYIQYGLLNNREKLLERGVLYPDCFFDEGVTWCHFGLFSMLRQGRQAELEPKFEACRAVGASVIVLSAEDFSLLKEPELAVLRSLVSEEVEIVFYVRRWCELLPSNAQEEIRQGGTRTLPEFCSDRLATPFGADMLNFGVKVDRISRVFGTDRFRLVSFNNVLAEKLDIFVHFVSQILGVDPAGLTLPTHRHGSVPIEEIELLRALNVLRNVHGDERRLRTEALRTYDASKLTAAMRLHEATMGLDEFARPLSTLYDELTARYASLLVAPRRDGRLFERQKKRLPYISPNYLLRPGIIGELQELYRMLTSGART